MILFALALSVSLTPHLLHIPPDTIVDSVACGQWEHAYDRWRTTGATIGTLDGLISLPPGDVTEHSAADLFWTLEYMCRDDMDGGVWVEK